MSYSCVQHKHRKNSEFEYSFYTIMVVLTKLLFKEPYGGTDMGFWEKIILGVDTFLLVT